MELYNQGSEALKPSPVFECGGFKASLETCGIPRYRYRYCMELYNQGSEALKPSPVFECGGFKASLETCGVPAAHAKAREEAQVSRRIGDTGTRPVRTVCVVVCSRRSAG